jgi:quercetin dioxygenase-like cupin family protein
VAETLHLTPHEQLTILREEAELLEVEARYEPTTRRPPAHYHPEQDEHFEVLEGVLHVVTPDGERRYAAGESFDVPRGTVHSMGNGGDAPARVRWQVRPALRTAGFFRALDRARTPAGQALALARHRREFRLKLR